MGILHRKNRKKQVEYLSRGGGNDVGGKETWVIRNRKGKSAINFKKKENNKRRKRVHEG